MTDYNKIYQKLREQYSDEEIADFAMIPKQLSGRGSKRGKRRICKVSNETSRGNVRARQNVVEITKHQISNKKLCKQP